MQNGSLPNAPPNPVLDIIEALQEEVDDMILGFEANIDRIKSSAIERFSATEGNILSQPKPHLTAFRRF